MAGTVAYIGGASGDGSITDVSAANPLPVTGVSVTIAGVTIANGADATQGAIADAAVTNPASSGTVIALLKGILTELIAGNALLTTIATNTTPVP